ncbi:MAG: helix-turn-helix transcriptional regulator [Pseudomonadota bacterium]
MDMILNQKIKQILVEKQLSPSYFADEIGVQRSSISHILSGRNKPSFEIIQKIVKRFPDLGYEWLMDDTNTIPMPKSNGSVPNQHSFGQQSGTDMDELVEYKKAMLSDKSAKAILNSKTNGFVVNSSMGGKTVERILIFYSDKSFTEYSPS